MQFESDSTPTLIKQVKKEKASNAGWYTHQSVVFPLLVLSLEKKNSSPGYSKCFVSSSVFSFLSSLSHQWGRSKLPTSTHVQVKFPSPFPLFTLTPYKLASLQSKLTSETKRPAGEAHVIPLLKYHQDI